MPPKTPHNPPSGDPSTPQRSRSRSQQSQQETPFKGGSKKKMNPGPFPTHKSNLKDFYPPKDPSAPQLGKSAEEPTAVSQDASKSSKEASSANTQGSPATDPTQPHQKNLAVTPSPSKEDKPGATTEISTPTSSSAPGKPHTNTTDGSATVSAQETQEEMNGLDSDKAPTAAPLEKSPTKDSKNPPKLNEEDSSSSAVKPALASDKTHHRQVGFASTVGSPSDDPVIYSVNLSTRETTLWHQLFKNPAKASRYYPFGHSKQTKQLSAKA